MKKKAFIFPGQGAQKPFMGKSFYDAFIETKEVYQEAEDLLNMNITSKIFSSDESFLQQTDFCQVALFVTSVAILKALEKQAEGISPAVTAGLSLGEYAALVSSKKAAFREILPIIHKRGAFMHRASLISPQGMVAVIGLGESEIPKKYQIANVNSPGQVVIAGSLNEMEAAKVELKELGAKRVIPLKVSGAFHSSYMDSAKEALSPFILSSEIRSSAIGFIMNVTGKITNTPSLIKSNLIKQVSSATRWLDCVLEMEKYNVDYIEIGPAQLCPINRKINRESSSVNIEEVKDIEKLYETI
jgi:[acyl-carrier-protein] S-malonyltransferase